MTHAEGAPLTALGHVYRSRLSKLVITHWPFLPALAVITAVCLQPVVATDLWLHLAVGRQIACDRAIPAADRFSHTAAGAPFVAHEWLSQALLYGVHRIGGVNALVGLKLFLAALAFGLLYWLAHLRCGEPLVGAGLVTLAIFPSRLYLDYRPTMFSLVLLALLLLQLERVRRRGVRWRTWLPFIAVLFVLWGNLHGAAIVGLAVLAVVCAVEGLGLWLGVGDDAGRRRQLTAAAAALPIAAAALCLNPRGVYMLWYGGWLAASQPALQHIREWQSPDFQTWEARGIEVTLLAAIALLAVVRGPRRLSEIALLLLFGHATLMSQRHGAILAAVAVPAYAGMMRQGLQRAQSTLGSEWRRAIRPVLAAAFVIACAMHAVARQPSGAIAETAMGLPHLPVAAVRYLKTHRIEGNGFNLYEWGGYLIWEAPQIPVFIDGRADVYYGDPFDAYRKALRGAPAWRSTFRHYDVRWALIAPRTPLRPKLAAAGWEEQYRDAVAVIAVAPQARGRSGSSANE